MFIKTKDKEIRIPTWLIVVAVIVIDNVISNAMTLRAAKYRAKEKAE